ncbi:hypothetical protein H310_03448 [Aphanomyces invadans]|uniref:EF-hand domain-containing protein n=1 Tax=Aphanomyces invadans TaxID=157072 RepID=A0A024UHJ3_9STRA|nr:hypothetical protein H310_03448 [Aphanomyces invadans]ETW05764.1 hypothetical protein H310_03448 [Aphanomyces invadans]|eukprot:XP_008865541.1 hypothetical protein H310_03448 [Aphanomyces invadans]
MAAASMRKTLFRNKAAASNVIFVNGIPLSKDILEDPSNNDAPVQEHEAFLDAAEMFKKYDRDKSGGIDMAEFMVLLQDLNFDIPDGKAVVYFRKCDVAQKGYITFDEFRVALFTCDPSNPARTGGFCPGKALTPKDIFTMFDADDSGEIGRDEFERVLKFLSIKMPLDKMESIFSQHENPDSEALDYKSFRTIWLTLVDVRKELQLRNIPHNKLLPKSVLAKKLEGILDKEDAQEQYTIDEAKWNIQWEQIRSDRDQLVRKAKRFANYILGDTLDAAGQVYVFGRGSFNRFDGAPATKDFVECPYFEKLLALWTARVRGADEWSPLVASHPSTKSAGWESAAKKQEQELQAKLAAVAAKKLDAVETQQLSFQNRMVAVNTAWLWGRRIKHVSCGSTVAYALTDTGELYCWGGSQRRWNYLYEPNDETVPLANRPFTARTEQLKLVAPAQVRRDAHMHEQNYVRNMFRANAPPAPPVVSPDQQRKGAVAIVEYFNLGQTMPPDVRAALPLDKLQEIIEFDLSADLAANAMRLRGLAVHDAGKQAIVDDLSKVLALEIECMGAPFHDRMKRLDLKYKQALHNNNAKLVAELLKRGATTWRGMRKLHHAIDDVVKAEFQAKQDNWNAKRDEIRRVRLKQDRIGRENAEPASTNPALRTIEVSGLTSRGPPQKQFHGGHALQEISVGAKHALAVHASGKIYGWGFGTFGRLGTGVHADLPVPQPMAQLDSMRFRSVAAGYSHSLALRNDGQVFVWGSAATGKLGLEPDVPLRPRTTPVGHRHMSKQPASSLLSTNGVDLDITDCFTIMPLPLSLPAAVRKIACGPSHSAAVTANGELFVWGSGDGGRLGLGDGRIMDTDNELKGGLLGVLTAPTLVTSLTGQFIVDVSCGVSHTAALTAIEADMARGSKGGHLYVCGSAHALGKFCPVFVALPQLKGVPISNVSCGNAHTAAVSTDGEIYTWGNNTGGCTGHTLVHRYVKAPTKLHCMYQMPENMARHTKYTVAAVQSSVNSGYSAAMALDGNTDGQFESSCSQTFCEICPFWQVDLGVHCRVDTIRVWNRTGADGQRLFPCCVMVSESPFEPESGKFMLRTCKAQSVWTKFGDDCAAQNPLVWHAPEGTLGRFVRVQVEATTTLSLAQVEVLGVEASKCVGPKASSVACGDDVTMVVCRPNVVQSEIDKKFLRALCADIDHLDVLKEYLAFAPSVQKFAGDVRPHITPCLLCTAQYTCPICVLFKQIPSTSLPPDVRATTSLDTFSDMLLSHRPPRTFATSAATVMMTDDANRLLQIAVDDEKPESDLAKAQDAVFATVHKAVTTTAHLVQSNSTAVQKIHAAAADHLQKLQDQARPMSRSFLRNAMASSKETWQKYTSGKPPREKYTPSGQGGNADVIRVQPKSASRPPLDDDTAPLNKPRTRHAATSRLLNGRPVAE